MRNELRYYEPGAPKVYLFVVRRFIACLRKAQIYFFMSILRVAVKSPAVSV